jgi:hypothetical protein
VRHLEGARFSAYNYHAFFHAANAGPTVVVIPEETAVATVRMVPRSMPTAQSPQSLSVQLVLNDASGLTWTRCPMELPPGLPRAGIEIMDPTR